MVRQDAAAIMEEWQRRREKYLQLSNEFVRTTERQIMCLDRAIAAHRRARYQDVVSLCLQVIEALLYGGAWPDADGRMWDREAKRADLYARSIEEELNALGEPSLLDLLDDPATLEACYGPLVEYDCPLGSLIYLPSEADEGVEKATLRWVFKDENGEILLLTSKSHPVDEDLQEREDV